MPRNSSSLKPSIELEGWIHEDNVPFEVFHRNPEGTRVKSIIEQLVVGGNHRNVLSFRRYAIVDEDQKRQALARTSEFLQRAREPKVVVIGSKEAKQR